MNQSPSPTPSAPPGLPPRMRAALERYRRRVWRIKIAEGVLAALCGLAVSWLAVFGLDRWFDTPAALRALLLGLGSAGLVVGLPLKLHRWVWRRRRLDQAAALLRHKYPRFGDHLLGVVELVQTGGHNEASRTLVEAAVRQVDRELEGRDLRQAVPRPRHRHWAWAAGVPLAAVTGLSILAPAACGNALARWIAPWGDAPRYTFAQLEPSVPERVAPYAEPFEATVTLRPGSPWKPAVATARYEAQPPLQAGRTGVVYRFQIPPQTAPGRLTVHVGDARRAVVIQPKLRPALTQLVARVALPAYLRRPGALTEDARGGALSVVRGSAVRFEATATRDLAEATLDGRPQPVNGPRLLTGPLTVETSGEHRLAWRDRFGLAAREPQVLRLEVHDDEPPNVALSQLKNNQIILSTELLTFEIQAADDFGVQRVGIEWRGVRDPARNPDPARGEKIIAAGSPTNDTLAVTATFSAVREAVRPQSLQLRAFAEDYRPDGGRAWSPAVILHVLDPGEHYRWLTEQMNQWVGAAREVHDREQLLHQINQELRKLPAAALDNPAQRRRIQEQSAAELANAARLAGLIESGGHLLREAARNPEFAPDRLAAWAEVLQGLEGIAGQRMPSVAGLLARAAEAPGAANGTPAAAPPANQPANPAAVAHAGPNTPPQPQVKRYGVENPPAGKASPGSPNPSPGLPNASVDRSKPGGGSGGGESSKQPPNPTPSLADTESGFNPPDQPGRQQKPKSGAPTVGGLAIPVTSLKGGVPPQSGDEQPAPNEAEPGESSAELVAKAVAEQRDLLDSFAALAGELRELLMGFESSTFVKRLKAASRRQIDLAAEFNGLDSFGLASSEATNLPRRRTLGEQETAAADSMGTLVDDLAAYVERRPRPSYLRVLDAMQNTLVIEKLRAITATLRQNAVGQATIEAEFWADTLDRWAEELVPPAPPGKSKQKKSSSEPTELPNLPPEVILEVLRLINREIQLREETRELEQARPALEPPAYRERAGGLSGTQGDLASRARALAERIQSLPAKNDAGEKLLANNSRKLTDAASVMEEAQALLGQPETGPPTIAAISEVIEILLETGRRRNARTVMRSRAARLPALLLMGLGDDTERAFIEKRAPAQATGATGRRLPEEFRIGLDAYLNALEGGAAN